MPPAVYQTLRDLFRKHVIGNKAVQDERDAAIEESKRPGAPASTEAVEHFFKHGRNPFARDAYTWLWRISTAVPDEPPPKTALERAWAVARRHLWPQLVRELQDGELNATGEKLEREPWRDVYRREIGSDTWLGDDLWGDLWFDVRTNRICAVTGGSYDRKKIPLWFEVQMRGADAAAEFEDNQPAKEDAPTAGKRSGRPPVIDWDGAKAAIDERVAKHGPFPRHKDDQFDQAAAVRRMMEWFNEEGKQRRGPSDPRQCYEWLEKNPQPWWGRGPEPTPKT